MAITKFLEIILPKLDFETAPEISISELMDLFSLNLSQSQLSEIRTLGWLYDVYNLRSFLKNQPMVYQGAFPRHTLQEKTILNEPIIPGTKRFFDMYPGLEKKQFNVDQLLYLFLQEQSNRPTSVAKTMYQFEYFFRHITAFLRAKHLEQAYEIDPDELPFDVSNRTSWPEPFVPLYEIFHSSQTTPLSLERSISLWKFSYFQSRIEELPPFSFERISLYYSSLQLLEGRKNMHNPQLVSTLEQLTKAAI